MRKIYILTFILTLFASITAIGQPDLAGGDVALYPNEAGAFKYANFTQPAADVPIAPGGTFALEGLTQNEWQAGAGKWCNYSSSAI